MDLSMARLYFVCFYLLIFYFFLGGEGCCKHNSSYDTCSMFVMPCSKCCVVKLSVNSTLNQGKWAVCTIVWGRVYRVMCRNGMVLPCYALIVVTAMKKSFGFLKCSAAFFSSLKLDLIFIFAALIANKQQPLILLN